MLLVRRRFLQLTSGTAMFSALPRAAYAQAYPARPVRLIVGFPAGGTADILARLISQWLAERLGQAFVVENRAGAGSNIAAEAAAKASPDGHTLFLFTSANTANATLYDKLNFNFARDFAPIASLAAVPVVLEINPSVPASTVPEFIAYAKANPGKLSMASGGNGTTPHLAGELFKMMAGVNMQHVPYRGASAALPDLISGQVQVMFDIVSTSIEAIRAGRLRALAVTTLTRSEALPLVPTMAEFVPGYEARSLYGVVGPASTPADIVDKLNKEVNLALADPKIRARLNDLSLSPIAGSPADCSKIIAEDIQKWAKVIKFAGLKPE
jgi:tripartite-type tricarboxylate transporter receptor subunit TctC